MNCVDLLGSWVIIFNIFNNCYKPFQALGLQFVLEANLWPNMYLIWVLFYLLHVGLTYGLEGISRGHYRVLDHSFIHSGEKEEVEEQVLRIASSYGLGNKEITWWACEHKFRSSLGVPTSVWIWAS